MIDKSKLAPLIMQNPVNTIFSLPISEIKSDDVIGTTPFTTKMLQMDLSKISKDFFIENFKNKYLIVDLADCHNNFYSTKDGRCICATKSAERTLSMLGKSKQEFLSKTTLNIEISEWQKYLKNFVELIKTKYQEENVFLHRVSFSEMYLDDENKLQTFTKNEHYIKLNRLISKLEDIFIQFMPNCKTLCAPPKPIASSRNKMGLYPLHYVDEVYQKQALKLKSFFDLYSIDINFIKE